MILIELPLTIYSSLVIMVILSISPNSLGILVHFCSLIRMVTVNFHREEEDWVLSLIFYLHNINCQSGRNWWTSNKKMNPTIVFSDKKGASQNRAIWKIRKKVKIGAGLILWSYACSWFWASRIAALSSLATFCLCEGCSKSANGEASGGSNASSANVLSSWLRTVGSRWPLSAKCSWAYITASSVRPARISSIRTNC